MTLARSVAVQTWPAIRRSPEIGRASPFAIAGPLDVDGWAITMIAGTEIGFWPLDELADAAKGLWNMAGDAVHAIGSVASAVGGVFGDVTNAVWSAAKDAAHVVFSLPGMNIFVKVFEEATHILQVILDSPITALCVVCLAAVLNVVGLGGPLLFEYAMLRMGVDLMAQLETGNLPSMIQLAHITITVVGSATGLPVGLAGPAVDFLAKAASGASISPMDVAGLVTSAAAAGAGASGSTEAVNAVRAVNMVTSAGVSAAVILRTMPHQDQVKPDTAATLHPAVVRHLVKRSPEVAVAAGQQDGMLKAMQQAQTVLTAAAKAPIVYSPFEKVINDLNNILTVKEAKASMSPHIQGMFGLDIVLSTLKGALAIDLKAVGVQTFDPPIASDSTNAIVSAFTVISQLAETDRRLKKPQTAMNSNAVDLLNRWRHYRGKSMLTYDDRRPPAPLMDQVNLISTFQRTPSVDHSSTIAKALVTALTTADETKANQIIAFVDALPNALIPLVRNSLPTVNQLLMGKPLRINSSRPIDNARVQQNIMFFCREFVRRLQTLPVATAPTNQVVTAVPTVTPTTKTLTTNASPAALRMQSLAQLRARREV